MLTSKTHGTITFENFRLNCLSNFKPLTTIATRSRATQPLSQSTVDGIML
ncbi:unnamed protein product, partial [Rotaria sp. Silwood1]